MSKQEGITVKKEEDFSEWYTQIIQKADLADYSPVKGCMIIKPSAYSIWEKIQNYFNKRLKKLGVKNAYFPIFIPESFFKKEAEHAKGFSPEVAWISNTEEGERLAIRPTSETVIYDAYSKWIRSHRDLPLRINQWANVVRWETKATKLFLRTREFLWQEGHCVYETQKECEKETLLYLMEYKKLCEEVLAIPVLLGKKADSEKFAGAIYTLSLEAIMPDNKALQMGTSHNLGQGFSKSFNIKFLDKNEEEKLPWQNSWGLSTRVIGAVAMVHGDNKGLILPPRIAENKLVIIPILFKKNTNKIIKKAIEIQKKLKKFNPILDLREDYSPGWKFNEYELKGIPLRIEIGPKDLEKKQITIVRRDTQEKIAIKQTQLIKKIPEILDTIQYSLFEKSKKFTQSRIVKVKTPEELKSAIENQKIALTPLCSSIDCENQIKAKTGAKTINIPFDQPKSLENCIYCKKPANYFIRVGKSY